MNRLEFKEEVLESNLCPDNFEKIYEDFCHFQNDAIRTLNEFHRVCEKNNVRYQLAFGSLLGAVRDNGQIPWDYDIDVFVPYNEKEKLVQALRKDLSDNYYFYCPEQDKKCRHFMMRLAPKGYKTTLLHVDVFYIIGAPEKESERSQFETEMQKFFRLRYRKLVKYKDLPTIKSKFKALVSKFLLVTLSVANIEKNMNVICEKYDIKKSKVCIPVQGVYSNISFETEKLWDTVLIKTEIGTLRITKNYDYVLSLIYGSYHKIYPLENRLNEMLVNYQNITGNKVKWDYRKGKGRYYISKY
ncbi:MAG: LicD family protein [Acidaminococcaceae bacterium]|nr:LicD family protein [Acidaminococcaceae bacterium]